MIVVAKLFSRFLRCKGLYCRCTDNIVGRLGGDSGVHSVNMRVLAYRLARVT